MFTTIGQIAAAIAALCGIMAIVYNHWLSPRAKKRKQALKDGLGAIETGDVSKITAAIDEMERK